MTKTFAERIPGVTIYATITTIDNCIIEFYAKNMKDAINKWREISEYETIVDFHVVTLKD